MMKTIYKLNTHIKRITALAVCFLMLFAALSAALPGVRPAPDAQVSAASGKTVTIYMSDYETGEPAYDFSNAFGIDTLVSPAYATGWNITWSTSDRNVADVDDQGHVLGMLTGPYKSKSSASCTITAVLHWNGKTSKDSIKVTVKRGADITGNYFTNSTDYAGGSRELLSEESSTDEQITSDLEHDHVECQMLVVFDEKAKKSEIKETLGEHDAELEQIAAVGSGEKAALAAVENEDDLKKTMEGLAGDDAVAYVQPNFIYKLDNINEDEAISTALREVSTGSGGSIDSLSDSLSAYAEDPYYDTDYQYFHKLMDTKGAWDLLEKNGISQTTTVGIIDSGVDADHADLSGSLILTDGKFRRFTGKTYVMADYDIIRSGHGTHVAGIVAATYGNGRGGAGAASGVDNKYSRILPACVVGSDGTLDSYSVINGINYAAGQGARVINMSFGSDVKDRIVGSCIVSNYNKGVVFVASGGNKESSELGFDLSHGTERLECQNYPADMKEVISVCNIDKDAAKHVSSYTGLAKDISAPGTMIYSTIPYDQSVENPYTYGALSGTSMAAPMVSAVCALILDANPDLTPAEVRNIICASAVNDDDYYTSREMGYGRIDARACVEAAYKAREAAQSGDVPAFSIKAYYAGEPEPYVTSQSVITASSSKSLSRVPSFKAQGAKHKIKLTFGKASLITTTKTETKTRYYTGLVGTTVDTKKTSTTIGVRYQIRVNYRGVTRYYKILAKEKKIGSKMSYAPDATSVRVNIKRLGSARYKSGAVYSVSVRPYVNVGSIMLVGKWSAVKKVKVK